MRVNGIQSTITALIMFLSPAVSGAILSVSTLETTLFIDVFTALIGVGITSVLAIPGYRRTGWRIMPGHHPNQQPETGLPLSEDRFLCTASPVIPDSGAVPYQPLRLPDAPDGQPYLRPAGMAPHCLGMTYSIGSVLGGILITSWGGFKKRLKTTVLAGWLYGVLMAGLGMAPAFLIYLACNMMIGITSPATIPPSRYPSRNRSPLPCRAGYSASCRFPPPVPFPGDDGIRPPGRCDKDPNPSYRRRGCRHDLYGCLLLCYNKKDRMKKATERTEPWVNCPDYRT